ncbi:MAG: glycoside hydrolase, partial [Candidatus Angelobacter sp.]
WDMNTDTPLPPDFPAGQNPPDGAMIDYYLQSAPRGPVTLEIKDSAGQTVRKYSSTDKPEGIDPLLNIPTYWVRPSRALPATEGMHRWLWDMHYPNVPGVETEYPISAVPHNTVPQPTGPWAMTGRYSVVLTVDGKNYSQPLLVTMDPRVETPMIGLQQQFKLSHQIYQQMLTLGPAAAQASELRKQIQERLSKVPPQSTAAGALSKFNDQLTALLGSQTRRPGPPSEVPTLSVLRAKYMALFGVLQEADAAPTSQATAGLAEIDKQLPPLMQQWRQIRDKELPALNQQLKSANLPEITLQAAGPLSKSVVSARDKDEE